MTHKPTHASRSIRHNLPRGARQASSAPRARACCPRIAPTPLLPLRRRRRRHLRPLGAGAQEHRRTRLGAGQLLHRHGVLRVGRRGDLRQPLRRRAHAVEPLGRLPARQVHVQHRLREQRRERLHGQDHVRGRQPRHVRRPHHHLVRLQERQERSVPQREDRRREGRTTRRSPRRWSRRASASPLADHHEEPDHVRPVRGDHRRGLPAQPLSLGALLRRPVHPGPRSPRSTRTRARATPRRSAPSTSCRIAPPSTPCTASTRTPGASSATPANSATCIRSTASAATGSSKAACVTTRRPAADFYQDIFPRADFANFMARDKELATYNAITAGVSATYEFKIDRFPWLPRAR